MNELVGQGHFAQRALDARVSHQRQGAGTGHVVAPDLAGSGLRQRVAQALVGRQQLEQLEQTLTCLLLRARHVPVELRQRRPACLLGGHAAKARQALEPELAYTLDTPGHALDRQPRLARLGRCWLGGVLLFGGEQADHASATISAASTPTTEAFNSERRQHGAKLLDHVPSSLTSASAVVGVGPRVRAPAPAAARVIAGRPSEDRPRA